MNKQLRLTVACRRQKPVLHFGLWLTSYFWFLVYLRSFRCFSLRSSWSPISPPSIQVSVGSEERLHGPHQILINYNLLAGVPEPMNYHPPRRLGETEKVTRCCGNYFIIIDNSLAPTTRPLMNFRQVLTWAQEESLYFLLVLAFQTGCRESPTQPSRMASSPSGVHWVLWWEKGQMMAWPGDPTSRKDLLSLLLL